MQTKRIDHSAVTVTAGFWKERQQTVRRATVPAVRRRFEETGRFEALRCGWRPGDDPARCPHIFWDSDVAKWIEGAAYLLCQAPDAALEAQLREAISDILQHADEDGYFNSHFLVTEQDKRFQNRNWHELYCAGHLIEAAIAFRQATGDDAFLRGMCRYADYIDRVFRQEKRAAFVTPGHPELELALLRLYQATGEVRYRDLAAHFIHEHGRHPEEVQWQGAPFDLLYNQDEMPLAQRTTAEGHCVRALYLYCAMADLAAEEGDEELLGACRRVFDNMTKQRMYITGGLGATHIGEAFSIDYYLPNRTAYAETCAAIAMALFSGRMQAITPDARYGDALERELYNGILSGISLDGTAFFYENPLTLDPAFQQVNPATTDKERWPITRRQAVFDCSCCPPNLVRFIPSVAGWMYSYDEKTLYVHQYIASEMRCQGMAVAQVTNYPVDGKIFLSCNTGGRRLALRIPGWCRQFTLNAPYTLQNGYAVIQPGEQTEFCLTLEMPVQLMRADPRVHADAGRLAVQRGPVVYCAEGVDNGGDLDGLLLDVHAPFRLENVAGMPLPVLKTTAWREQPPQALYAPLAEVPCRPAELTLIPYCAFANRAESEMRVWLPVWHG